ncbi:MAG: CDP-alcohol phosphatidyltransferase family protein [Microbacteriaceae bacterium]
MASIHLGMLEERTSIGVPNALTLIRANLPALERRLGVGVPAIALITDFLDGKISRAAGAVTHFGEQADFLADAAVWAWFTVRHETNRWIRAATFAAWVGTVVAVGVCSFAGGAMKDIPRSRWVRPAAVLEVLIGVRFVCTLMHPVVR